MELTETPIETFEMRLFKIMGPLCPAVNELAFYEFCYALKNLKPEAGWENIPLKRHVEIESMLTDYSFYEAINPKQTIKGFTALDPAIKMLTQILFSGLVREVYTPEWVNEFFYFDVRSFIFYHRTCYFDEKTRAHFGGMPFRTFETRQDRFSSFMALGYHDFQEANTAIDDEVIAFILSLIKIKGVPLLITLAGPTAAGKTEIAARLEQEFDSAQLQTTFLEMDNFLIDRAIRGEKAISKDTIHFDLLLSALHQLQQKKSALIPRYDFIRSISSHAPDGALREGYTPIEISPADIVFIEGNFPFQMPEISDLIGLKIVYMTDDPIRLKRKWKRDIDYRKKYDPIFLANRYFKTQFLRASDCYIDQIKMCDILIDTTKAEIWATPAIQRLLG